MTNLMLVDTVGKALGLPSAEVRRVLDATFDIMSDTIAGGDTVKISRFGSFTASRHEGRRAVNVATGEAMDIPPSYVVKFKPSEKLKNKIREANPL